MRILKLGEDPIKELFQGKCHSCGTIIEAERWELNVNIYTDKYYYECPLCSASIDVVEVKERE